MTDRNLPQGAENKFRRNKKLRVAFFGPDRPHKARDEKIPMRVPVSLVGGRRDKERMAKIINRATRSKKVRELMGKASEDGYRFGLLRGMGESVAVTDNDKKYVFFNPVYRDEELVIALGHEARHVEQDARFQADVNWNDESFKSSLFRERITEADANAHGWLCAWEQKEKGDKGAWESQYLEDPDLGDELKEIGLDWCPSLKRDKKMLSTAFEGWFDHKKAVDYYEEALVDYFEEKQEECPEDFQKATYKDELPLKSIADTITSLPDGSSYMNLSEKKWDSERYIGVMQETKNRIATVQRASSEAADPSLADLPVRDEPRPSRFVTRIYDSYSSER